MSQFSAQGNATSSAHTSTEPRVLVTSSATATSNTSQQDAQNEANSTAQQVANSVAQNNANIITQTINCSTAEVLGKYAYLNIYYAVPTDVGNGATFTGLVFPNSSDYVKNALVLNYIKPIFYIDSLTPSAPPTIPIPNAVLKGTYNLTYENNYANNTSVLTGQRTTYKYIPYKNGYIYNATVSVNAVLTCKTIITPNTKVEDINGNISKVTIINKMSVGLSSYTPSGNFDKYNGVQLEESYPPGNKWNYIFTNFNNASIGGSSTNIYPINLTQE